MSDLLRTRPAATLPMIAVFDDVATIRHFLAFESALARAQAAEGLTSSSAAGRIADACSRIRIDPAELAQEATIAGTLAIPLVKRLRDALPSEIASMVHQGATSQDLADTAMMLQVKAATSILLDDVSRVKQALARLAQDHAATPAIGRTLLQDALPISLGLRFVHWLSGICDGAGRLTQEVEKHAAIQFGGAAGTRAGFSGRGEAIARHMAEALGLPYSPPWHSQRSGVAGIAASVGVLIGALGKIARDISLLSQNRLGELREPAVDGRGGSSAMAHKRNPTGSQVALSAALRAPGLVSTILAGLPAEQERGIGGWQAEAPVLAELFLIGAASAEAIAEVTEGLEIDAAAICGNLVEAGIGTDIGESANLVTSMLAQLTKG